MFAEIISAIKELGGNALPFAVVDQYQKAVILRFGKYHRELDPGLHWKIPFVDVTLAHSVVITTTALSAQSIIAPNGLIYTVEGVVKWSVAEIRPYACEIWDGENVIIDSAKSAIAEIVSTDGTDKLGAKVTTKTRSALKRYGIAVDTVTLTTIAPVRCIRLITDKPDAVVK